MESARALLRHALTVVALAAMAASAVAGEALDACDRHAVNPLDPDRVTPGVERADVDIPAAIAACRAAVAAHSAVPRFSYQLARVLFYAGETEAALASFRRAADQDYRQARFMLGLLMTRRYPGVPQDECKVADYWLAAARQDHANAQVSYVRDALKGRFQGCAAPADAAEMRGFLDRAAGRVDYLGGLLVADLKDRLAANGEAGR